MEYEDLNIIESEILDPKSPGGFESEILDPKSPGGFESEIFDPKSPGGFEQEGGSPGGFEQEGGSPRGFEQEQIISEYVGEEEEIRDLEEPMIFEDPYIKSLFDIFCKFRETEVFYKDPETEQNKEEFFKLQIIKLKKLIENVKDLESKDEKVNNYKILFIANLPDKERVILPDESNVKSVLNDYSNNVLKKHIRFTIHNFDKRFDNDYKNVMKYFKLFSRNAQYMYDFIILNYIKHLEDNGEDYDAIVEHLEDYKFNEYINFIKEGVSKYKDKIKDFIINTFFQEHEARRKKYLDEKKKYEEKIKEKEEALKEIDDDDEDRKKLHIAMIEEYNLLLKKTNEFLDFFPHFGTDYNVRSSSKIGNNGRKIITKFIMQKYKDINKTKYYNFESATDLKEKGYKIKFIEKQKDVKDGIGSLTILSNIDKKVKEIIHSCCELSISVKADVMFILNEELDNNLTRMIEFSSREDPVDYIIEFCENPKIKRS